ncbi:hypothetical protein C8R45DRAFT_526709 [Mycena sanguinolenta]|nr:hypothetical protein C8R45DRAFT_526709 [Mycena sanguinolenta]
MSTSNDSRMELTAQFELLQTWLSLSGSCPLSLSIPCLSRDFVVEAQLLQMAVLHRERWEHLDLGLAFGNLHFLQCPMPLLRHLTFGLSGPSRPHRGPIPLNLFDCAPRLKNIVLTYSFDTCALKLPWHQLTHLRTYFLLLEECVEILRHAVSLVHCDFGICGPGADDSVPFPTLPVPPHLTHLILQLTRDIYSPGFSLLRLFANLTMPALHSLRVYEPGITLQSLQVFFSRSRCSLQELRVDKSSVPESTYRAAFPSVKTIMVEQ